MKENISIREKTVAIVMAASAASVLGGVACSESDREPIAVSGTVSAEVCEDLPTDMSETANPELQRTICDAAFKAADNIVTNYQHAKNGTADGYTNLEVERINDGEPYGSYYSISYNTDNRAISAEFYAENSGTDAERPDLSALKSIMIWSYPDNDREDTIVAVNAAYNPATQQWEVGSAKSTEPTIYKYDGTQPVTEYDQILIAEALDLLTTVSAE